MEALLNQLETVSTVWPELELIQGHQAGRATAIAGRGMDLLVTSLNRFTLHQLLTVSTKTELGAFTIEMRIVKHHEDPDDIGTFRYQLEVAQIKRGSIEHWLQHLAAA